MAEKKKGGLKELSPITIYKSLPKTNCKECGVDNCMAFATKIVNREIELDSCKPLLKPENAKSYTILKELLKPAVKEVIVGVGDKAKKIGGKLVMYRHEFTYKNPTAIAIDVTDEMSDSEIVARVQKTDNFTFEYIGNTLKLDLIAVRCTSGDADKFKAAVKKVSETTKLPMILCTMNPAIAEAGLMAAPKAGHAILSFTPMDLNLARELNRRLYDYVGKEDIIMDLTTAALGYGLDYAFTNMERARMGGLMGDSELAHPMSSGTTNAWAAREAWLKMSAEWEPRELRGPLWEVTTAITLLLAGVDLFMMMHPAAVKTLKDVTNYLTSAKKADPSKYANWVTLKA